MFQKFHNCLRCFFICYIDCMIVQANRVAIPMDIEIDKQHQNILDDTGYANMLFQTLNLRPGSGCFTAPVCSTWVFMLLGVSSNTFVLCLTNISNGTRYSLYGPAPILQAKVAWKFKKIDNEAVRRRKPPQHC